MLNLLREQLESVCRHSATLTASAYVTSSQVGSPLYNLPHPSGGKINC